MSPQPIIPEANGSGTFKETTRQNQPINNSPSFQGEIYGAQSNIGISPYALSSKLSKIEEAEEYSEVRTGRPAFPKTHLPGNRLTIAGYMNQNKKPAKSWGTTSSKFDFYKNSARSPKKNMTGKKDRKSLSTNSGIRTGTTSMTNGNGSNSRAGGTSKGSIFSNSSYSEIGLSGILRQTASKIADKAKKLVRFVSGNSEQELPDDEGSQEMKESKTPPCLHKYPTPDVPHKPTEKYEPENNQTDTKTANQQTQGGIYREPLYGTPEPQSGFVHLDDSINEQFLQLEKPGPSYEFKAHPAPTPGSSSSRRPNSVNLSERSIASKEKSEARKSRDPHRHSRPHYTKSNNNNITTSMNQYGEVNVTNVVNNITLNVSGLVGAMNGAPKQNLTQNPSSPCPAPAPAPAPAPPNPKFNLTQKSPNNSLKKSGDNAVKKSADNAVKRQPSIGGKTPDGSTSLTSSLGFDAREKKKKIEGEAKKIIIDMDKFKDAG
jgi:hypothetical protein